MAIVEMQSGKVVCRCIMHAACKLTLVVLVSLPSSLNRVAYAKADKCPKLGGSEMADQRGAAGQYEGERGETLTCPQQYPNISPGVPLKYLTLHDTSSTLTKVM